MLSLKDAAKEAAELREKINRAAKLYYVEDSPEISDYEYDMMFKRLSELEALYPAIVTEISGLSST